MVIEPGSLVLTTPPRDRLFRRAAILAIRGPGSASAAQRLLRTVYPDAGLSRQDQVLVRSRSRTVWFARRGDDGDAAPDGEWWQGRNVARLVLHDSGRVTGVNGEAARLLGLPAGKTPSMLLLQEAFQDAPSPYLRRLAAWVRRSGPLTTATTLRLPRGGAAGSIEFHLQPSATGGGHRVSLRSQDERERTHLASAADTSSMRTLPRTIRTAVLDTARRQWLVPGQHLPEALTGDPWVALCITGVVRLYFLAGGLQPTLYYRTSGSLLTSTKAASPGSPELVIVGLQALTQARLLVVAPPTYDALLTKHPAFEHAMLLQQRRDLDDTLHSFATRASASLGQRLAHEITMITDLMPGDHHVPATEQQLADGIGSMRESVGRIIADLRRRSLVATTRHGVIVTDREGLRRYAEIANV